MEWSLQVLYYVTEHIMLLAMHVPLWNITPQIGSYSNAVVWTYLALASLLRALYVWCDSDSCQPTPTPSLDPDPSPCQSEISDPFPSVHVLDPPASSSVNSCTGSF